MAVYVYRRTGYSNSTRDPRPHMHFFHVVETFTGAEMRTKFWGYQRNMINHAEPRLLNPLRPSPAVHEKAWLFARLLSSMDTHLPERAFSLTYGAFILGVPSSRKRKFGGAWAPPAPPVSPPLIYMQKLVRIH